MTATMLFLAALLQFGDAQPISWEQALRIEIKTGQVSVKADQRVPVSVMIRNSGSSDVTIEIWACAFPSEWVVESPLIEIEQPNCLAEARYPVVLKPGEVFRRDVTISVHIGSRNLKEKKVSFR